MKQDIRARIIQGATFLGGLYFFLEYVTPASISEARGWDKAHEPITNGLIVLASMAIGLGVLNLVFVHGKRTALRLGGWINSAALLIGMFSTLLITSITWMKGLEVSNQVKPIAMIASFAQKIEKDELEATTGRKPLEYRVSTLIEDGERKIGAVKAQGEGIVSALHSGDAYYRDVSQAADELSASFKVIGEALALHDTARMMALLPTITGGGQKLAGTYRTLLLKNGESHWSQKAHLIINEGLFIPLGSAMFALLGVYIASAAFRAFRVRSFESALLMIAALLVMLGQISFGTLISEHMPAIRQWLLEVPNSAAFRAIRFGAGIAGLLLAIRMWLSIESRSFSGERP
jgi:hypothetical protein